MSSISLREHRDREVAEIVVEDRPPADRLTGTSDDLDMDP